MEVDSFIDVCKAQSKGEPLDDLLRMFVRTDRKQHLDTLGHVQELEVEA